MPIYEYVCSACGHELETIQKISEEPLVDCPKCGQPGLKKQISAAGFRLKGSGWYATDFKGDNKKKEKKERSESNDDSAKSVAGCGTGACGACTPE